MKHLRIPQTPSLDGVPVEQLPNKSTCGLLRVRLLESRPVPGAIGWCKGDTIPVMPGELVDDERRRE